MQKLIKLTIFLFFVFYVNFASANDSELTQKMLDSTVYLQCELELNGKMARGGTGTGFLIDNSEYVITNDHVINRCHPDNKKEAIVFYYFEEYNSLLSSGRIREGQINSWIRGLENVDQREIRQVLSRDLKTKIQYLAYVQAMRSAEQNYSNFTQNLFAMIMGKEVQQPIKIDISTIVWASSEKGHEDFKDSGLDLAVLKLSRSLADRPSVTFATGSSAQVNDPVHTVGFPGASGNGVPSARYIPTLKKGIVSKLGGESPYLTKEGRARGLKGVPVIEVDAAINSGNSGGPLYNEYGEVLGINTFGLKDKTSGFGWAQDIAVVIPILKDLGLPMPKIRKTPRTWLDKNLALVGTGSGATLLGFLLGGSWLFLQRRRSAPVSVPRGDAKPSKKQGKATRPPMVSAKPAIKGKLGEFSGITIPIPDVGLILGRQGQGAGKLGFNDLGVSRQHCTICFDSVSQHFEVTDLGSSNGTFLLPEGKRLNANQKYICNKGRVIRLGQDNEFELAH